ncbi:MAG: hypothetical protein KF887_18305 [Paracoccaceae bacterium]|nr:MAG: hypothetical protein KF887_18305 [Paracoccaceae bacterium]
MTDPNLQDFYARIARVQAAHARGHGFEAEGLLGRSHYTRPRRRRIPIVKPLTVAVLCLIGLKATIHYHVGDGVYRARVAALSAGDSVDQVGAFVMAPDPAMLWVSSRLQAWAPR